MPERGYFRQDAQNLTDTDMINIHEVIETNNMIEHENLDVRTITIGISLLDCADGDVDVTCENICNKIRRIAGNLKKTAEDIATEFGVPIVNKRNIVHSMVRPTVRNGRFIF